MTRFIDWNGTGNIDSQDIATSVVLEEAARDDGDNGDVEGDGHMVSTGNAGCLTAVIPIILLPLLIGIFNV